MRSLMRRIQYRKQIKSIMHTTHIKNVDAGFAMMLLLDTSSICNIIIASVTVEAMCIDIFFCVN